MKKQVKYQMRLVGLTFLGALALAAIDGGQMGNADAGVRIRARLNTPRVTMQYQTGPVHHRYDRRSVRPLSYRVTPRDRWIARRLAAETGQRRIVLLDMRSRGLSWRQVSLRFGVSGRFLRFEGNSGYGRPGRHHGRISAGGFVRGRGHGRGHGRAHGR